MQLFAAHIAKVIRFPSLPVLRSALLVLLLVVVVLVLLLVVVLVLLLVVRYPTLALLR